ncbi:hypothetical protein BGX27_011267 [Mortierella sp. AM989]|nr:hypothetical protein BGX27_011267 [Mortierella sp. AM989]
MDFITYQFESSYSTYWKGTDEYMDNAGQDLVECCYRLFVSKVFQQNMDIVALSIIDRAIKRTSNDDMWVTYHMLYYAGKEYPKINHWMFKTEFFAKLRHQILQTEALVDETFLNHLLNIVECTRNDDAENFNYSTIKLLLVFNEQYMLDRPGLSCTFGENLIFMLNRAEDTALQMLILKLLYVLFTSPSLYEFFYTNDLHVLVDIVIRELWDLPEEEETLRHAYLRVLGPLLANTQLKNATYKRAELVRLLRDLGGGNLDSTLRQQLYEQHRKEQLLELERAQHTKFTYRDRESSVCSNISSSMARWTSDRSGRSSPVLSFEIGKNGKQSAQSKLSINSNSNTLQVPGYDESEARNQNQQVVDSPEECKDFFIGVVPNEIKESAIRSSSPTTLRLVERVLREWLDNEMKNGAGTTGVGLSVRGVTDVQSVEN